MDSKLLDLVVKSESIAEDGTFEGFAAVYGNVDSQGDRIDAGALSEDAGKDVTLLWSHKRDEVVGVGRLEDSPEGMTLKGRLLLDTQAGREAYSRLKSGAVRGLSVGLRLLQHAFDGAVRVIRRASIAEVSLTAFPANPAAVVTAVKHDGEPEICHARPLLPYVRRIDWNLFQ